ncbi:MAG TPA: transglycosylase SLT domain-containing protein [Candidatus Binatia bacterium]|nr:transglycosylase SLT domain-containing protein [Candidatus Binatia bacterium]
MRRVAGRVCVGLLAIPAGLALAPRGATHVTDAARTAIALPQPAVEATPVASQSSSMAQTSVGLIHSGLDSLHWYWRSHRPSRADRAVRGIAQALSKCRSQLSEKQRWRIARAIDREARRAGYDPFFVQALVEVESTCTPTARSSRGAVGLTQIQAETARALAREVGLAWRGAHTLLEPELNLRLGLLYLSQLYDKFGDIHVAMAAYNVGPARAGRLSRASARRFAYVRKVLARYEDLLDDHGTRPS